MGLAAKPLKTHLRNQMRSQPKGQGLLLYRMYSIALTLVTLVSQIIISNQRTIHKTFFFTFILY